MTITRAFSALAALALAALGPAPATAQDWPTRTIKIIVGFGAGGGTDIVARIVAQKIGDQLTADWLKRAGAEGQAVVDAYKKM